MNPRSLTSLNQSIFPRIGGSFRREAARAGVRRAPDLSYAFSCTTFFASGPLSPSAASNSTFAPSLSDLKPSPAIDVWWTNKSLPSSSGEMNPYPLESLNHLTVPVAIKKHLLLPFVNGRWEARVPTSYSLCGSLRVAASLVCRRFPVPIGRGRGIKPTAGGLWLQLAAGR